jgi:hypothetical protein
MVTYRQRKLLGSRCKTRKYVCRTYGVVCWLKCPGELRNSFFPRDKPDFESKQHKNKKIK